jgi:hypothetical protein
MLFILLTTLRINANEELDRKIDMKDFGNFYPAIPTKTSIPSPHVFSKPQTDQPHLIKGCIKLQNWVDDIPEFRVLFEGEETLTDENGFFTLWADEGNLQKYRLIITRGIRHIVNKRNTLKNLQIIPDKNYLCYSFKKLGDDQGLWVRESKKLDHKNFIVPKNSIILLVDPKYVDRVEDWNICLAENIIKIPRIVLKSEIEMDRLKRLSAKSLLYLDDSVFHERIGKTKGNLEAKNSKVKVTLP